MKLKITYFICLYGGIALTIINLTKLQKIAEHGQDYFKETSALSDSKIEDRPKITSAETPDIVVLNSQEIGELKMSRFFHKVPDTSPKLHMFLVLIGLIMINIGSHLYQQQRRNLEASTD